MQAESKMEEKTPDNRKSEIEKLKHEAIKELSIHKNRSRAGKIFDSKKGSFDKRKKSGRRKLTKTNNYE